MLASSMRPIWHGRSDPLRGERVRTRRTPTGQLLDQRPVLVKQVADAIRAVKQQSVTFRPKDSARSPGKFRRHPDESMDSSFADL